MAVDLICAEFTTEVESVSSFGPSDRVARYPGSACAMPLPAIADGSDTVAIDRIPERNDWKVILTGIPEAQLGIPVGRRVCRRTAIPVSVISDVENVEHIDGEGMRLADSELIGLHELITGIGQGTTVVRTGCPNTSAIDKRSRPVVDRPRNPD